MRASGLRWSNSAARSSMALRIAVLWRMAASRWSGVRLHSSLIPSAPREEAPTRSSTSLNGSSAAISTPGLLAVAVEHSFDCACCSAVGQQDADLAVAVAFGGESDDELEDWVGDRGQTLVGGGLLGDLLGDVGHLDRSGPP